MQLETELYAVQAQIWPRDGRHILAHYDAETIVVYQAYCPAIGEFAIRHNYFGGDGFKYSRMSWIKPNFLWMMYRCGWGTKEGQETVLGVRMKRIFFDSLLAQAVASSFHASNFATQKQWQTAMAQSDVRLQWDPDHSPAGGKLARRAIQLGLKGPTLAAYGCQEILEIIDMTAFVAEQRQSLSESGRAGLVTPKERVYRPASHEICHKLGLANP